jgi:ComF family protein
MLLKSLKYQRSTASLKTFQWIAGECDLSIFEECDLFLPVPLHLARLQARGLNQSLLLLQALFGVRKRDIRPMVLRKTRNTPPQTTLDGIRRRKNLKNCYEITDTSAIMEAVVCLVDDVYTTGTTVAECAKELLRQGCREVRVLTLARARGERR